MPTKKLDDQSETKEYSLRKEWNCRSLDHNVASHQVFQRGKYQHTCSDCGKTFTFTVD